MMENEQTQYLIVPGWHGSESNHWQSHWQRVLPNAERVEQQDWITPKRVDWLLALDEKILEHKNRRIVLIAHSLGCIAVAHWSQWASASQLRRIGGALLVAPADIEREGAPDALRQFGSVPLEHLPFPSVLVGSTNDPAASAERAILFGRAWGSHISVLNNAGHINVKSGHTTWEAGFRYLFQLQQRMHRNAQHRPAMQVASARTLAIAAKLSELKCSQQPAPMRWI